MCVHLHDRVVVAIAAATHAADDPVRVEARAIVLAGIPDTPRTFNKADLAGRWELSASVPLAPLG